MALLNDRIKKEPNYAWALATRGAHHNGLGNFKQCRDDLTRAFALTNDGRDLKAITGFLIIRAFANMQLKHRTEAYADIERVAKMQPTNQQYLYVRGEIEERFGSPIKAFSFYEKALSVDPSHNLCLDRAIKCADKLKLQTRKAKILDDCVKRSPNSHNLRQRAMFNASRGRWKEAMADSRKCIQLDAKANAAPYQILCQGLLDELKNQQSEAMATEGLKAFPNDIELKVLRGTALFNQRKDKDLILLCRQMIQDSPKSPEPYELLGRLFRKQKRYEDAIEEFNKAAAIREPNLIVLEDRAHSYKMAERYKESAADFEELFKRRKYGDYMLKLGESHMATGNNKLALKAIERALDPSVEIKLAPRERLYALTRKAQCYDKLNEPKKAMESAEQVLLLDPGSLTALHLHAQLSIAMKNTDNAIKDFTKLIELRPNFALNYLERAKLYKLKNENVLAQKDLDTAARLSSIVEGETFPSSRSSKRK